MTQINIAKQIIKHVREQALTQGLVTDKALEAHVEILNSARKYNNSKKDKDVYNEMLESYPDLTDEERLQVSNLNLLEVVSLNSVKNKKDADARPDLETYFVEVFEEIFGKNQPIIEEDFEKFEQVKNDLIIATITTMHPKIFHTNDAINYEKDNNKILENVKDDRNLPAAIEKVKKNVTHFIGELKAGRVTLTPQKQVTVPQEDITATDSHTAMKSIFSNVFSGFNAASDRFFKNENYKERAKFTPKQQEEIHEDRQWEKGADGDGRPAATSLVVQRNIYLDSDGYTKPYDGPMFDLRQNAEVHENTVSALVQVALRNSRGVERNDGLPGISSKDEHKFEDFCVDFIGKANQQGLEDFKSPSQSIYQELGRHKATFAKEILASDFNLIPQGLNELSVAFTKIYVQKFEEFKEKHNLPDWVSFTDLKSVGDKEEKFPNLKKKFQEEIRNTKIAIENDASELHTVVKVDGKKELTFSNVNSREIKFFISRNGLQFQPNDYSEYRDVLEDRVKLGADGQHEEMSLEELGSLMDVTKRLAVIDDAISNEVYGGQQICDRHAIANFGQTHHYYEAMILFKESGLITMENGLVTDSKIAVMPLLETGEDMDRAIGRSLDTPDGVGVMEQLLRDPMVLSYVLSQGGRVAHMFGYSDGGKSIGNYASERKIYNTKKALAEMMEAVSGDILEIFEEIGVSEGQLRQMYGDETMDRVLGEGLYQENFDGPGRGGHRGGQKKLGDRFKMSPSESNKYVRFDQTVQGDQHVSWNISQSYGEAEIGSVVAEGIKAGIKARTPMSEEEKERQEAYDNAADWIAERSEKYFKETVREHDEVYTFLKNMPKNPFKSSRKSKRGATVKEDYESLRAIGVEHADNFSELDFHDVGLRQAFEDFVKEGIIEVPDARGEMVSGMEALQVMYKEHEWFKTMVDKLIPIQERFSDNNISDSYAKGTQAENFVIDVQIANNGLEDLLKEIAGSRRVDRSQSPSAGLTVEEELQARFTATQVAIHTGPHGYKLDEVSHSDAAQEMRNNCGVLGIENSHQYTLHQEVNRGQGIV